MNQHVNAFCWMDRCLERMFSLQEKCAAENHTEDLETRNPRLTKGSSFRQDFEI